MVTEGRRRFLVAMAAAALGGCMETPPPREGDDQNRSDDGDGTSDSGEPENESDVANDSAASRPTAERNATADRDDEPDAFPADVWFQTDRVRSEINTFQVSVRVELRGSEKVRVSAGGVTRTYNRSGTYVEVARVDLGTTVRAEAYDDGGWTEVNAVEVPVEGSASGF